MPDVALAGGEGAVIRNYDAITKKATATKVHIKTRTKKDITVNDKYS